MLPRVDRETVTLHRGGHPAEPGASLDEGDRCARIGAGQGRCKPRQPAAYDDDPRAPAVRARGLRRHPPHSLAPTTARPATQIFSQAGSDRRPSVTCNGSAWIRLSSRR